MAIVGTAAPNSLQDGALAYRSVYVLMPSASYYLKKCSEAAYFIVGKCSFFLAYPFLNSF
jgi:hypothetical protein